MSAIQIQVFTVHVPVPLIEKVDEFAARLERSRGWIVTQALTAWIRHEDERSRLTRGALADVDAGRVIAHDAVLAWAHSLMDATRINGHAAAQPLSMPKKIT